MEPGRVKVITLFRASGFAAVSQGLGLLQYIALLAITGATQSTDAFFLLAAWTAFPAQAVLFGALYPHWLRSPHSSPDRDRRWILAASIGSGLLGLAAAGFLILMNRSVDSLWLLTILVSLGAVLGAAAAASALLRAAEGTSEWLAALTLPASVGALLMLGLASVTGWDPVVCMALGIAAGNAAYLVLIKLRARPAATIPAEGTPQVEVSTRDNAWFLAKSVTGYGGGLVLQTTAATLPASNLTILAVASKVVGGFAAVLTNALLPRFVHRDSRDGRAAVNFMWLVLAGGLALAIPLVVLAVSQPHPWVSYSLVTIAWVVAATLNSVAQRLAYRFLPANVAGVSVAISIVLPFAVVTVAILASVNLAVILAAYVVLDLSIGFVCALLLKRPFLAFSAAALSVSLLIVATRSL
jgi:hypothetical protein